MIDKIFESLDEKVFTDELKESLEASFNEAVEMKAVELAEAKIDELSEKADEFKATLVEEYEAKEEKLIESVDAYLEKVVEEFIAEAKESLDENLKAEKADMVIEAFDSMLIATGTKVSEIVEAKEASDVENKLAESIEKYDALIEENIAKEKEIANLIKMGVIAEMKEGLSIVEAEKFAKLADLVEFSKDETYATKLETIKESVKGAKSEDKTEDKVNEDVKDVKESKSSFAHLI